MPVPVVQASFAAGELSPHLHGRVDLTKYKIGAELMQNFIVDYKGGAGKRAGTRYVGTAPYNSENTDILLIPFQFNSEQGYVLEFGHGYMRVISNGGYVLDPDGVHIYQAYHPYPDYELKWLKWTQSADVMTLVHPRFYMINLTRYNHNDWRFTWVQIGSQTLNPYQLGANAAVSGYVDPQSAVYVNYAYGVTAVGEDGTESIMSPLVRLNSVLDMTAHRVTVTINWVGVQGAQYYNVYKATTGVQAQHTAGSRMGFLGSTRSTIFTDSNILPNFTKTPPINKNPFQRGQIIDVLVTGYGAGYPVDATAVIDDPTGVGAVISPIIVFGAVSGFVIENSGWGYSGTYLDDPPGIRSGVYVYGSGGHDGYGAAYVGPKEGTYPQAVTYFQQRLIYAGSINNPATIWGSKPGAFNNFDNSIPVDDGDSYEFTLASQQLNAIKYMVAMPGGLVVLTSGGAWQLSGTQQFAPVTPTSIMATPQAFNGCADVPPIAIGYEIFFVQAAGSIVRNLSYNFFANIYTGQDATVLSSHLFTNRTIKSWAFAEEPDKAIWLVRDDGILLTFTYLKEQEVSGWAWHETEGQVKSVCSIREGNRDVLYMAVRRLIPSVGYQVYIERMMARKLPGSHNKPDIEGAWFLDCALNLPLSYPSCYLYSGGFAPGQGVLFYTQTPVWGNWIGLIIRAGGGRYQIVQYVSQYVVIATPIIDMTDTYTFDAVSKDVRMTPQAPGEWSLAWPVGSVSGLSHLEGCNVVVFADGELQSPKTVSGGAITLDKPASRVLVGLPYEAKLKTLRLESQPTVQTKRKKLPFLTIRVAESRGFSAGMTWETLTDFKERPPNQPMNAPLPAINGDMRIVLDPLWDWAGQVCIRSHPGLPANILAVIPEVVVGDD